MGSQMDTFFRLGWSWVQNTRHAREMTAMLQATPQRFGPRLVMAPAAHQAAELRHPAPGLATRGGLCRRRRTVERAMQAKRADYFACGTLIVWDVDLLSPEVIKGYRASTPDNPTPYRRGDIADAEPAVPGWRMPVDDLFG